MLCFVINLKIKFNFQVQYLHCNNAGKNQAFKKAHKQEGPGINFKYTAPGMPQQNGYVKCKFTNLFNWVCAMLNGGKFPAYLRCSLWAEAANTAMFLKNNVITPNRTLIPFQQFFGKGNKSVLTSIQKFGEICITTYKDNIQRAKLANHRTPGIWVSYTENHPTGIF